MIINEKNKNLETSFQHKLSNLMIFSTALSKYMHVSKTAVFLYVFGQEYFIETFVVRGQGQGDVRRRRPLEAWTQEEFQKLRKIVFLLIVLVNIWKT